MCSLPDLIKVVTIDEYLLMNGQMNYKLLCMTHQLESPINLHGCRFCPCHIKTEFSCKIKHRQGFVINVSDLNETKELGYVLLN